MSNLELKILTKEFMINNIDQFINIERETSDLLGVLKYGKAWGEEELLYEVKDKWNYSICAVDQKKIIGYLIVSSYHNSIHGHRLAMNTSYDPMKKIYITKCLYDRLNTEARQNRIDSMTAIVPQKNTSTAKFYLREEWVQLNNIEIDNFILERGMDSHSLPPNLLVDNHPIKDEPSKSFVFKYFYKN